MIKKEPLGRSLRHPFQTSQALVAGDLDAAVFSLASPEGGEGRGEEAPMLPAQIPSPQPSPRLGGEREPGHCPQVAPSDEATRGADILSPSLSIVSEMGN
jgi:hypothetical protein